MKQSRLLLLGVLFVLLVLPFFLGATGAHPATDDFTFATYTHPTYLKTHSPLHVIKDALSYTLRTWRDWQGTMTGVFLMALNPAVFSLSGYGLHAVLLLLLHLTAWFVFLHHFLAVRMGLPGSLWLTFAFVLSACSLIFLPDMVEGIYWFNGAWFYTGAQAIALLTLSLCDSVSECRSSDRFGLKRLLCALLLFLLGMDNFITAMMCLASLFAMALVRLYAARSSAQPQTGLGVLQDSYSVRTAFLLLIPIAIGLLISVVAPGNKVRMATDGAHESGIGWMLRSVLDTLIAGLFYTGRFTIKTPLLAFLLFLTPKLLSVRAGRRAGTRQLPPALVILGYYLILCAMLFPHIYSSGYAGSGRVINMYHDYVLIALPLVLCLCLPDVPADSKVCRRLPWNLAALAALILCLCLGQGRNYVKLVTDQLNGVQDAYTLQFQNEYAILEAATGEEDEVLIPAWQVQTVTGKPTATEDPAMWTNESMATYFGVRSIRVVPAEEFSAGSASP